MTQKVSFSKDIGVLSISGVGYAEPPDASVGLPGSFELVNLHIRAPMRSDFDCMDLNVTQLATLCEIGFSIDELEQLLYEDWRASDAT